MNVPPTSERLVKLQELCDKDPSKSFTRYGIAMELKSLGRRDEAIQVFLGLIESDPDYVMAYQHGGYLLREANRTDEARILFERGISVARKVNNSKALAEIEDALDDLD